MLVNENTFINATTMAKEGINQGIQSFMNRRAKYVVIRSYGTMHMGYLAL